MIKKNFSFFSHLSLDKIFKKNKIEIIKSFF